MASFTEVLKRIRENGKKVRDKAQSIGDEGTPTQQDKDDVEGSCDSMDADIDLIFNANTPPTLSPPDAGDDPGLITWPDSRLEICQDAYDEACAAYDAMIEQMPSDDDACGTALKALQQAYIPKIKDEFDIS